MCEREYKGCPECSAPTDQIRYLVDRLATEIGWIDADGDVDDWTDSEYGEASNERYECQNCGGSFYALDPECVDEACECAECDPDGQVAAEAVVAVNVGVDTSEREDTIVLLLRDQHHIQTGKDSPLPEIRQLYADRACAQIAVRQSRLTEMHKEAPGFQGEYAIDTTQPHAVPEHLQRDLIEREEAQAA